MRHDTQSAKRKLVREGIGKGFHFISFPTANSCWAHPLSLSRRTCKGQQKLGSPGPILGLVQRFYDRQRPERLMKHYQFDGNYNVRLYFDSRCLLLGILIRSANSSENSTWHSIAYHSVIRAPSSVSSARPRHLLLNISLLCLMMVKVIKILYSDMWCYPLLNPTLRYSLSAHIVSHNTPRQNNSRSVDTVCYQDDFAGAQLLPHPFRKLRTYNLVVTICLLDSSISFCAHPRIVTTGNNQPEKMAQYLLPSTLASKFI